MYFLLAALSVIHFARVETHDWQPHHPEVGGQSSQKANVLHSHNVLGEAAEALAAAGKHSPLTSQ